jgi:hypothetical protein
MPVFEHGRWAATNVGDLNALVGRWNGAQVPYTYNAVNSNTFAHWFGNQAGFPVPVEAYGAGAMHQWLYGWNNPTPGGF